MCSLAIECVLLRSNCAQALTLENARCALQKVTVSARSSEKLEIEVPAGGFTATWEVCNALDIECVLLL